MGTRIKKWYDTLKAETSDMEIAVGLQNGTIEIPEWMGFSEGNDNMKIWDVESGSDSTWGFMTLEYNADNEYE